MQERIDLLLDFTHTYPRDLGGKNTLLSVDCSSIGGTDMYCTLEAEQELKKKLAEYSLCGVHFLDSGNYHYMTRLFTQKITEPYQLVVFDNHTDMQPTMIPELMSCGAWAKQVIEEDSNLKQLFLMGPAQSALQEIQVGHQEKLICISGEELQKEESEELRSQGVTTGAGMIWEKLNQMDTVLPVYLSIDKDVLSEEHARTNWDQGQLSLKLLQEILQWICSRNRILGVDICGELPSSPSWQAAEAEKINRRTNEELYAFFRKLKMD